jgi:hypothetical protein
MATTKVKNPGREVFVPNDSFSADVDGVAMSFVKDHTRVREGHPVLAKYPHLFEPMYVHYDVEAATAAPGEKRA